MLLNALFSQLSPLVDGARIKSIAEAIHENDRWFDFTHFEKTARYVARALEHAGLSEIEMLPLKADGVTRYGDWVIPRAWDVAEASLSVEGMGVEGLLAEYRREPCCLAMYSAPARTEAAPVTVIDDPGAADGRDLTGHIIFTRCAPGALVGAALRHGAVGIVSDYMPPYPGVRTREDVYDAYRWENDFIVPLNDTGLFAFTLSPRRGDQLRALCASQGERLRLRAAVGTRFYDGVNYTVSGLIEGSDPAREIMMVGHLYEPGANDNATGCAGLIELAGALKKLRPRHPIRLVMGFECAGLMGYWAHHADRIAKVDAAINLDMIGAAEDDHAFMHLWHNPLSNYSFLDTLLSRVDAAYREFTGESHQSVASRYAIGDNLLADPSIGVPTVSLIMHPARSYHSSADGMEQVSPGVLARNVIIAGVAALAAAGDASWLAPHIREDIDRAAAGLLLTDADKPPRALLEAWALTCALSKIRGTAAPPLPDTFSRPFTRPEAAWIPRRLKPGTVTLLGDTPPGTPARYPAFYNYHLNAPLYWMDGRRNLGEVTRLSACEFDRDADEALAGMIGFAVYLEKRGYLMLSR